MLARLFSPLCAIFVAGIIAYVGWRVFDGPGLAIAIVVSSPIIAFAVAKPLLDFAGGTVELARELAYRDIEGRYF